MAIINFATREITAKIVYFGPAGAGCNTNLKCLHKLLKTAGRSQLHKFGPSDSESRTYYFEYLTPRGDNINDFQMRFRVYSLPGGLGLAAHRHEVMTEVDALVFVADARIEHASANLESLLELERFLSLQGLELAAAPVVLQVNHADSPSARPLSDVVFDLNPYGFPVLSSVASQSLGVVETHAEITGATRARIRDNMAGNEATITLTAVHRATVITDEDVIRGHIEAIQGATQSTPPQQEHGTVSQGDDPRQIPAPVIEVPFQPRDFLGSHPTQVLSARVQGGVVALEVVMEPMSGGNPRHLTVHLANRPTDSPAIARHRPPSVVPAEDRVSQYLPERVDFGALPARDLPPLWYGILGLSAGILIGALSSYVLGFLN
jgi:hypothetical protein